MTTPGVGPAARAVVNDHPLLSRFEIHVDGQAVGYARYRMEKSQLWLLETVIEHGYRGLGLERVLMDAVLRNVHRRRVEIVLFCPLFKAHITTRREYSHLVAPPGPILASHRPQGRLIV